jgi:ubiquinone biosynthesis monooxygenase Coq7
MTVLTSSRAAPKHLVRGLASYAYHLPPSATVIPKAPPAEATTSSPIGLTPRQRQIIERTIRVDQAGELGANYIYKGQKFILELKGDKKSAQQVEVSVTTPHCVEV